jgi:hypothetical protein
LAITIATFDQGGDAGSHRLPAIHVDRIVGDLVREVEISLDRKDRRPRPRARSAR